MEVNRVDDVYDLLVIGGGINGVGIAADAAGRGLDVVLCEKGDLAGATSSWSTKLIHGGLRYLEYFQFSLVRKALREREILTRAAPHLIKPMPFQIPLMAHSRSSLLLQAGLFIYDNLATSKLYKGSRRIRFDQHGPLNESIKSGFEYWDAQVDDSRLVIHNAMQARDHGAHILTRSECVDIQPESGHWKVTVRDHLRQRDLQFNCRVLVNASGPWVSSLFSQLTHQAPPHEVRLVKGSHIVVPKIYDGKHAFMLQHHDGRIIFVIPYLGRYSLIGTTEEEFSDDLDNVSISNKEINYLISITNLYFRKSILRSDIVYTYAGVRPLIEGGSKSITRASRDYEIELVEDPYPLLSVYGGKVTTYRVLAETVMNELGSFFPRMRGSWTRRAVLPGGNFELAEDLYRELARKYAWLGPDLIARWQNSYGTLSFDILKETRSLGDMGVRFGANLYQREVDYLCTQEWARTADDILWRRSKLGYQFSDKEKQSLANYIQQTYPTD
ncbi:MAG: glycerol-3-phosphate dehydrogenase [Pseudohongiellaceae bacterium]